MSPKKKKNQQQQDGQERGVAPAADPEPAQEPAQEPAPADVQEPEKEDSQQPQEQQQPQQEEEQQQQEEEAAAVSAEQRDDSPADGAASQGAAAAEEPADTPQQAPDAAPPVEREAGPQDTADEPVQPEASPDDTSDAPPPQLVVTYNPMSPTTAEAAAPAHQHLSKFHVLELLEPVQEELAAMARGVDDTATTLNLRMDRLNVELYNIRQEQSAADVKTGADLAAATQHLTSIFVERLGAEQKAAEATADGLNRRIAECYDALSGSLATDTARLEKAVVESAAANANAVATHAELMQTQLDALVAQCNATMAVLTQNVHELHGMVTVALTKEILPPGPDIPDGPKIRLVVTFSGGGKQSTDVMVPISLNATIGMVKREIIRRLSRQNLVGDDVTYSNSILSLDGVVLFEDDTLDDVGITANERMTLGLVGGAAAHSSPKPPSAGQQQQLPPSAKLAPTPSIKAPERPAASAASPAVATTDSDRVVRSFFLDAATATSLSDHESLDRRLMFEMARMELEPLAQQERLERVGLVKTQVNKLRVTLLDRATYSHVEAHRAMARSALEKLNDSTARPTVSVEDLRGAQKLAEATLSSISSTDGERNRVDAMNDAIKAESGKKSRLLQDIKDLIFEIRHRLRIPPEQLNRAERVIDEGERAIILAPSMTSKELDEIHLLMVDFASGMKK